MNKLGELQLIFRRVLEDDQLELTETMTAPDVPGWDSLGHLNLVIAIEKHFGIRFATAEISRLKEPGQNVGTLIALINSKGV